MDAIGTVAGKTPKVERAEVPPGDVDATFADIVRAKTELAWQPRVPLTAGLESVRDWVNENP